MKTKKNLTVYNVIVTFQEIPDEISLTFNLSNCPYRCKECHSEHLQKDIGDILTEDMIDKYIDNYITCVLFMGGDNAPEKIFEFAMYIKTKYNKKVAWYSGNDNYPDIPFLYRNCLDYIKIGSYKKELGGLKSKTTNQILYKKGRDNEYREIKLN
jgi:anaerobic ribonucleoside-triphosphate reductase activating protein